MPRDRRSAGPGAVPRALVTALCLGQTAIASAQQPPQSPPGPRPTSRETPFRSIDLYGLPVRFVAMNDEACPLQLLEGRTDKLSGSWVMSVQVKSLADATIDRFRLDALVFDPDGRYEGVLHLDAGPELPPREPRWVELAFDRHALSAGDVVVVAVRETLSATSGWRSDRSEVRSAAQQAVRQRD